MSAAAAPLPYNLLELYRQHRDEVDVLTDETALYILAFTNEIDGAEVDSLAGDLNLSLNTLRAKLTPLLRGQMMLEENGSLVVTALGKRLLAELGFITPPIPPSEPKKPEPPKQPSKPPVAQTTGAPAWLWGVIAFLGTGVVALAAVIAIAVFVLSQSPSTPTPAPQIEIVFTADRTNIIAGECATLSWQVHSADWVELNGQRVNLDDTSQVCPQQTTTYSLVAGGRTGGSRNLTVTVQPAAPTQVPPTPVPPTPDAQIVFTVDQPRIRQGDCTTLRWDVQGGISIRLDEQSVDRSGQRQVCPQETTTYQLAVDLGNRVKSNDVSVSVEIPIPTPLVNTFPLGQKPLSIAFDPSGKQVYVGTYDGTILVLDAATRRVIQKASVPGAAVALAPSPQGDRLYVATFETNVVFSRDTRLAVSSARGGAYSLNTNNLDIVSKAALQFLGLPRMTISPNGQFLFLTDSADKSTTLLVLETSQLGQVTRVKDGTSPQFTTTNRQSSLLFVPSFADDAVSEYNIQADQLKVAAAAGAFSPFAQITAKGGPSAVALNADESLLYIGMGNVPSIDVANTKTLKIDQTIAIPSPVLVTQLSPNGRWLAAISRTTDHVYLIDTGSNRLIDDIGVSKQPSAFDFAPDNQTLWVTNSGDDSISIVTLP